MLVLTRKQGQSVVIGGSVEVFVVEIRGEQVRLGIQAPRDVPVVRREVADGAGLPASATGDDEGESQEPPSNR